MVVYNGVLLTSLLIPTKTVPNEYIIIIKIESASPIKKSLAWLLLKLIEGRINMDRPTKPTILLIIIFFLILCLLKIAEIISEVRIERLKIIATIPLAMNLTAK